MKKLLFLICLCFFLGFNSFGQVNPNSTYVKGYYKSNGIYVNGYYRTTPNSTINDNYSTAPNVNPYTGKSGTIQPKDIKYTYPTYTTPTTTPVYYKSYK